MTLSSTQDALASSQESMDVAERSMVEGCVRGDRLAMARLYNTYRRRVFSLAVRMVGIQDAEELAQDVFVRMYRGLSRFRGESTLSTWTYRVTMNVCLSYLAKQKRRNRIQQGLRDDSEPARQQHGNPWLRRNLEQAMLKLPDGYRAVLILHDVEGLKHEEVAAVLGCRVGTSKSQLHKARMKMRTILEPMLRGEGQP